MNTQDTKPMNVAPEAEKPKAVKASKQEAPEVTSFEGATIEGRKQYAKTVDQGESARQLLEQALPYVSQTGFKDYSGSPDYVNNLRDRIQAYLELNKS
jgi:hypothetical protein